MSCHDGSFAVQQDCVTRAIRAASAATSPATSFRLTLLVETTFNLKASVRLQSKQAPFSSTPKMVAIEALRWNPQNAQGRASSMQPLGDALTRRPVKGKPMVYAA